MEGTRHDNSLVSLEASSGHDHLLIAKAEVTEEERTLQNGEQKSRALHRSSLYPPYFLTRQGRTSHAVGVWAPLLYGMEGTGQSHACGLLYSVHIWKIITLFALIL